MTGYLAIALVSTLFIATKAFQQLNVVWRKYKWIPPMSFVMAACEVFIVTKIVQYQDWWTVVAMGTGASLGCLLSMYLHPLLTGKGYGNTKKI